MRVRHPNAVRETEDAVDSRVYLRGQRYEVGADGTIECDEAHATTLAGRYGVDVADIAVDDETTHDPADADESETCEAVKTDGEVCGRELPCPYHSED